MLDHLVYVAGPITKGCLRDNVGRACAAGLELLRRGVPNVVPHLTCYMGLMGGPGEPEVLPAGTTHADWYGMDLHIVRRCTAVLRLPGESVGADLEVACARENGIPVFDRIDDLVAWARA